MLQAGRLVVGGLRGAVMGARQTVVGVKQTTRTLSSEFSPPYTVPQGAWGENRAARLELAAAYRGLDQLGLNEGVCNHLSVMAPRADGSGETMLVISYGAHWSEVKASGLVGVDENAGVVEALEGSDKPDITASCIHLGIRRIRPDAKHNDVPTVETVGAFRSIGVRTAMRQDFGLPAEDMACLKDPTLLMLHQNSVRFYERIAYDCCYSGLALALDEGRRMGRVLGDKDVMFMGNHGVVVLAPSMAVAFDQLYYLERAAMVQILAQSTQKELALIAEEDCKKTASDIARDILKYSNAYFYSMYRKLRRTQPEFEQ